jgi:hypothetical protein
LRATAPLAVIAVIGSLALPAGAFTLTQEPLPIDPFQHNPRDLEVEGAVPWDLLRDLDVAAASRQPGQTKATMSFPPAVEKLDRQEVKLVGFLYPLATEERTAHFLLTAYPPTCPFCLPGGAADMVEVRAAEPVAVGFDPIVLTGRLALLRDDPSGLLYRLEGARVAR